MSAPVSGLRFVAPTFRARFASLLGVAMLNTCALEAQTTVTWNVSSGNWSAPGNWSAANTPDTAAENATISNGGTVTLDAAFSINNLTLSNGALTNVSTGNASLTLAGTGSDWRGGTLNSSVGGKLTLIVGTGGSLLISTATGADHDFNGSAIENNGTVNWQAGALRSGTGGTFSNLASFNDTASSVVSNPFGGTTPVFTNAAGGTYTKSAAGTTRFDIPFNNSGTVSVTAGTLQLNSGGTSATTFTTGAAGTVVFSTDYALTAGSVLSGLGAFNATGGTFTVSGNVTVTGLNLAGATLAGSQAFSGALAWTGGSLNSVGTTTIASGASLSIAPNSSGNAFDHDFNSRGIVNHGTVNWQAGAGPLRSGSGGTFTNHNAFNDAASSVVNSAYGGTALIFTNATGGTYTKSAAGTTRFDTPFNNDGNVVVNAGTLQLNGGGTNSASGTLTAGSGAKIVFSTNYSVANGSSLLGTGAVQVTEGTFSVAGSVNVTNFQFSGGTLAGTHTFDGGLTWNGGNLGSGGTTTIGANSTLAIAPNGSGNAFDHDFNGRAIVNHGTVNWQAGAGPLRSGSGGTFTNHSAFNDAASSIVNSAYGGTALIFTNASGGTYTKSAAGTTRFDTPFNNDGDVVVNAGTLQLNGGGTNSASGGFTAGASGSVLFSTSYQIADGSKLLGTGTYRATGGTFTVGGTVTVSNFQFSGDTLAGTHTFDGGLTWNGGNLSSSGTTTIGANSTLAIAPNASGNAFDHDFNGRAIVNHGTVNWQAGAGPLRSGSGGTFTNHSAFNDAASSIVNSAYGGTALIFTNATGATYTKSAAGTTRFDTPFNNDGNVVVNAGTLQLNGGGTNSASGIIHAAATTAVVFSSSFTLANASSLTGTGAFSLTAGTLTATGTVNVSNFALAGGTLAGSQAFNGGLSWTAGNQNSAGTTTIGAGSVFTVGPTAGGNAFDHDFNARTFVNDGTITRLTGAGPLRTGSGGGILNRGLFLDAAASQINGAYGGTATFTNAAGATYRKTDAGTTDFTLPLIQNGILDVQAGVLALHADSSFNHGSSMTGAGLLRLVGGTLTASGTSSFTNLEIAGSAVAGTHTLNGKVTWTSGHFNNAGATTLGGTTDIGGSGDHDFNAHAFTNTGTVNWLAAAGRIRSGSGGTFTNQGTFIDAASNAWNNDHGGTLAQFINAVGGTYQKTRTGTTTFGMAVVNQGTFDTQLGTLAIAAGGSSTATSHFSVSGGATLSFTGGAFHVADGAAFTGTGAVQIAGADVTLGGDVSAPDFQIVAGTLGGTHRLVGGTTWTAGNLNAAGTTTIGSGGTLTIGSAADHDFSTHALVNQGTVTWTGGRLRGGNGATLVNEAVFNDSAGSSVNNDYGGTGLTFTNATGGTYRKSGANTTTFLVPFHTSGSVDVAAGSTLALNAGGSIGPGASFTGTGQARLAAGIFAASGSFSSASLVLAGATLSGTHTFSGLLEWDYGNFNAAGLTTIALGGTLQVATAADHDFSGHAFVNDGTFDWTAGAGRLRSGNGGTFTNNALFRDGAGSAINSEYGGTVLVFTNAATGTYRKTAATTTDILVPFTNRGIVDVQAGTLALHSGGTIDAGASFTGAGSTRLVGGTFTGTGAFTATNLVLAGATLAGTPILSGAMTWSHGPLAGGATTTIASGGTLTISSASDHDLSGHALVNQGIVQWTGGRLRGGNGATITNHGVFNDAASSVVNNDYGGTVLTFTNAGGGTYTKSGAGTTTFQVPFSNTGTIQVQSGTLAFASTFTNSNGSLLASGGTLSFGQNVALGTGVLGGAGTVSVGAGNIVSAGGEIRPGNSAGILTLTGSLVLDSAATLRIELGGTSQGVTYDFLSVSGSAQLGGELRVTFLDNFQSTVPAGATFTVLTAASPLTGLFSNAANGARFSTFDGFGSFQVNYGAASAFTSLTNSVVLSNFVPVPEPSTWALLILGALGVAFQLRRRR